MPKIFWKMTLCWFLLNLSLSGCRSQAPKQSRNAAIEALSEAPSVEGFQRALKPRPFSFPADDGPHPDFQTEWWYYTGHLHSAARRFGYQFTIFRRGLLPGADTTPDDWTTHQIYFAHFTLSDIEQQRFYPFERWERGALGLAGAQAKPFKVWLNHWALSGDPQKQVQLRAETPEIGLQLNLKPLKPEVLQGNQGLSKKNAGEGNASYYYSRSRIQSQGQVRVQDQTFAVTGESWLDREWSTSVLSAEQQGWDWFSLQLNDGRELMLYQLRLKNGRLDAYSSGTLIDPQGQSRALQSQDFEIRPVNYWTSPKTGVRYPSGWELKVKPAQLRLQVRPLMPHQELPLSFTYWEGAVEVLGDVQGKGYVELTGYATEN